MYVMLYKGWPACLKTGISGWKQKWPPSRGSMDCQPNSQVNVGTIPAIAWLPVEFALAVTVRCYHVN